MKKSLDDDVVGSEALTLNGVELWILQLQYLLQGILRYSINLEKIRSYPQTPSNEERPFPKSSEY